MPNICTNWNLTDIEFMRKNTNLRVWFDLSNSPHINFFHLLIKELENEGHTPIITCRPLANTIDLLDLHGISYKIVGKHYGASKFKKAWGYPVRIAQLYRYLRGVKPDIAISHSSFHSPIVGRLLGIPSIYLNDNEHAFGNVPSFIFANRVMIPEFLDRKKALKQGAADNKLIQYPGVKEGIYLWNFNGATQKKQNGNNNKKRKVVYLRPEPWLAQYYTGKAGFLDKILIDLKQFVDVVLLPRGEIQAKYYKDPKFAGIKVAADALLLSDVVQDCDLFIGAGGTMTREMAILGLPTISIYQSTLLDVDKYLIKMGYLIHKPKLTADEVIQYLEKRERLVPDRELLKKGKDAYFLIKNTLLEGFQNCHD